MKTLKALLALCLLCLPLPVHALEVVTAFGPTVNTNVGGRDHYVFDMSIAKTQGWWLPYVGIETLFGEANGQGSFNPTSAKFDVGIRLRLTDNLSIVADHYSRHAVDKWGPTERFTAFKLEHVFRVD